MDNKKLQRLAFIAEIIGGIAVIISLVYVGVGIRQNTDALHVSNHQALVAMDMEKNTWLRDADFASIYVLAREDISSLTPVQSRQYLTFVADTFNAWEFAHITYSKGAMEENIWNGWDGYFRSEFSTEGGQKFWNNQRENFSPAFRSYVDSISRDDR